ncbi:hypothetical protein [Desulfogranum japonicum]|uniref:hypothetical protein n=1 Tax=Desulfogranum japonicum TaxID=231447 RepID=UPI0003F51177|nr:hypothetical protein [Desulfogranum japonicum]
MANTFSEIKLLQVKPDKFDEFEEIINFAAKEQEKQTSSFCVKYMKRFYTMNGLIKEGLPSEN